MSLASKAFLADSPIVVFFVTVICLLLAIAPTRDAVDPFLASDPDTLRRVRRYLHHEGSEPVYVLVSPIASQ